MVRAGWVPDTDIADLAAACYPDTTPLELDEVAIMSAGRPGRNTWNVYR
jgi:hypothetical protein